MLWVLFFCALLFLGFILLVLPRLVATASIRVDVTKLKHMKLTKKDTLFVCLQKDLVSFESQEPLYGPLLEAVQVLIGMVPTCDVALAVWPPAFHCYNVIVPGCLNLPNMFFGFGACPKQLVSLAMYASSKAAACRYCTMHTCSFALRRGTSADVLREVGRDRKVSMTPIEEAVADVAWSLGSLPTTVTREKVTRLRSVMSSSHVEWIVAACAMFGSFNKLMDATGVPVEGACIQETNFVLGQFMQGGNETRFTERDNSALPPPPRDDFVTLLRVLVIGLIKGGAALDARLVKGVPSQPAIVKDFLLGTIGSKFDPIFDHITLPKFVTAVATVVKLNFEAENSVLGIQRKIQCAARFASFLRNNALLEQVKQMARFRGVDLSNQSSPDEMTTLALRVTDAISPSPVAVSKSLVEEICANNILSSKMIVELISMVATLQMLHRISSFYGVMAD